MDENKLPAFDLLETLVEFFNTNDMAEYDLPMAQFDVSLKKPTFLLAVDGALIEKHVQSRPAAVHLIGRAGQFLA